MDRDCHLLMTTYRCIGISKNTEMKLYCLPTVTCKGCRRRCYSSVQARRRTASMNSWRSGLRYLVWIDLKHSTVSTTLQNSSFQPLLVRFRKNFASIWWLLCICSAFISRLREESFSDQMSRIRDCLNSTSKRSGETPGLIMKGNQTLTPSWWRT